MPEDSLLPPASPHQNQKRPVGATASALRAAWHDPDSFATTLLVLFCDRHGMEAVGWTPHAIVATVREDAGKDVPRQNLDKLLAAITVLTTNYFYRRIAYFNELSHVLCGDSFSPHAWRPLEATDAAWAITEALFINPPDMPKDGSGPFATEIARYVDMVLANEGIHPPPAVLRIGKGPPPPTSDEATTPEAKAEQLQRGRAVTDAVKDGVARLIEQVKALPLEDGDATGIEDRLKDDIWPPGEGPGGLTDTDRH